MKIVKDLLLALVNATVLLLIILGVVVTLLVSQINGLVVDTTSVVSNAFRPEAARLERIALSIENIEEKITNGELGAAKLSAINSELQQLNEQILLVRENVQTVRDIPLKQIVEKLSEKIGQKLLDGSQN